ncbi:MAG: ABC transporter ATP-binding protein, partial [Alsobacter sp.]
ISAGNAVHLARSAGAGQGGMTRKQGIALMIVEQNVPRTLKVVERALIMKSGRLVSDVASSDLVGRKDLWEWF